MIDALIATIPAYLALRFSLYLACRLLKVRQ